LLPFSRTYAVLNIHGEIPMVGLGGKVIGKLRG
jgi:hypothetical protein